jgi:hypothetical protein
VASRPIKLYSKDCAAQEYDATPDELDKFAEAASRELNADRKGRRLKPFTGMLSSRG